MVLLPLPVYRLAPFLFYQDLHDDVSILSYSLEAPPGRGVYCFFKQFDHSIPFQENYGTFLYFNQWFTLDLPAVRLGEWIGIRGETLEEELGDVRWSGKKESEVTVCVWGSDVTTEVWAVVFALDFNGFTMSVRFECVRGMVSFR